MPIPIRRALNYFRASPLYCIARWRMAATPFCIASKFITAAAAEIETLLSIVWVCFPVDVCANVLSMRVCVCVCVLTNSHGAQNGNDYISYKSSAIRVPPPRPQVPAECPLWIHSPVLMGVFVLKSQHFPLILMWLRILVRSLCVCFSECGCVVNEYVCVCVFSLLTLATFVDNFHSECDVKL